MLCTVEIVNLHEISKNSVGKVFWKAINEILEIEYVTIYWMFLTTYMYTLVIIHYLKEVFFIERIIFVWLFWCFDAIKLMQNASKIVQPVLQCPLTLTLALLHAWNVMLKRVVVTGLGCVSPLGLTAHSTWKNLIAGECGITLLQSEGNLYYL